MMMQLTQNRVAASRIIALGVLLAALLAASVLLAARPAHATTTFTVTNTNDSDAGSLRQAILDANATTEADTINFNIPTTATNGVATISPTTALPTITSPVTIDGYSQPGAEPNTLAVGNDAVLKIELSGQNAGSGASGLRIEAANSTVKGLVINRWGKMGILMISSGATGNKVVGNYVGTDASGTQGLGNSFPGVAIDHAPNNTIGGATAGERNIISANGNGVFIAGDTATGNKVAGNYVGTDASGTQDLGNSFDGVVIHLAPNNTIGSATTGERNIISANGNGVFIAGDIATGNKVAGNYVGTDASGTQDLGNSFDGVAIDHAPNNTIGGATAGERNIISANNGYGVFITGDIATGNKVAGNYVGTDASGTQDLGNSLDGVGIHLAPNNTIGSATAGERNIISGNDNSGINITGDTATGNKVAGNYIGTDASGTKDLGNSRQGVLIYDAPNNTIGSATTGERNIISSNEEDGIAISGADASGNKVVGNYVGTDASGTKDLGNSRQGLLIYDAPNNTIGGATTGTRNIISGNEGNGINIAVDTATGNRVLSNSIFSNGALGIDLGIDGPTANDGAGDADVGPNNLQNSPLLSSAKVGETGTTVRGQLGSTANSTFTIRFFSNPPGTDEGRTLIGQKGVTTDASGNLSFTFTTNKKVSIGKNMTATVTNRSTGDTSEFSAPKVVVAK